MSSTDIIARLKLNATGFSNELNRSLGDVERKFGTTGSVIGRNFSAGVGGGLQEAASRVPVLGNALAGLSGPALVAAGAIGAISSALAAGISDAEGYQTSFRGLQAVLSATGNQTGYTAKQLADFADQIENQFAIAEETVMDAEKALSSFDGVSGSTFKRAIVDAADLAAVYGGDLVSNSEKLGSVLQNLAQGNVEGLSKSFKFLGADTLESIANLAKLGKTAEAQELLLDSLEKKVGGAGEANAQGLSGAYNRLKEAITDANREFVTQSGLYDFAVYGLNKVANAAKEVADWMSSLGKGGVVNELAKMYNNLPLYVMSSKYRNAGRPDPTKIATAQGLDADPYKLNRFGSIDDIVARRAAELAYRNRQNDDGGKSSRKAGKSEADRRAEQEQRITEEIARQKEELQQQLEVAQLRAQGLDHEANLQEALYGLYRQFPGVDQQRLQALEELIRKQLDLNEAVAAEKDLEAGAKRAQEISRKANDELARQKQDADNIARAQISDLADYYETLFGDGVGSIWKQFKQEGLRAIAEIAAAYTLALLSGQKPSLEGLIGGLSGGTGSVFSSQGGGLIGQAIGSVLNGGGFGGIGGGSSTGGGIWINPSALPGGTGTSSGSVPAAGSLGPLQSILGGAMLGSAAGSMFGGSGLGSMLGGAAGQAIGSSIAALGSFGGPIGAIAGGILGGLVGGLFKKTKKGVSTLGFDDGGLGIISTTGNSTSRKQASISAGNSIIDALESLADQLGGTLGGSISTSIGIRKKNVVVDPTGQGRTKGAGVLNFGQDEQAAIEAAIRDALSDGVITGISEASKRILAAGKDLQKAIEMAVDIESIPKRLKAFTDPLGAAIDELNAEWADTWEALRLGQASAEQMAQAQKLYNLELQQVKSSVQDAAQSLKDFQDSLKFGSNSPLSLRDQEVAAKAELQPFLNSIRNGQTIDQAAYQEAAQAYLDIERQLYGSTSQFFTEFNKIQAATSKAIATIDGVQSIAESPTAAATAQAAAATATSTRASAEILAQHSTQLANISSYLQQLVATNSAIFIAAQRGFV